MKTHRESGHKPLNLLDVEGILRLVESAIKALMKALDVLPHVDEAGGSECPFAEELYAKMEEAKERLQGQLQSLYQALGRVKAALDRCKKRRETVTRDRERLHGEAPKRGYSQADEMLESEYRALVSLRSRIEQALEAASKVVAAADAKQFPGRKPQKPKPQPKGPDLVHIPPGMPAPGAGGGGEIQNLIQMGPTVPRGGSGPAGAPGKGGPR